jgi:hypothetical protein
MGAKSMAALLFCVATMPLVSRGATLTFDECVRLAVQTMPRFATPHECRRGRAARAGGS